MKQTPKKISKKGHFILLKSSSLLSSPKLLPVETNEIPSPFILSNTETISSSGESYPLSDNEISKNNFKNEKCFVKKRQFSNKNLRKKFEEDENEKSCFFINIKQFKEDEEDDILSKIEVESESNNITNDEEHDNEINNDDENNLDILNILRMKKIIKGKM